MFRQILEKSLDSISFLEHTNRYTEFAPSTEIKRERIEVIKLLSRDCGGCSQKKVCGQRYRKVQNGEKVYCPDGTVHLVDSASKCQTIEFHIADTIEKTPNQ
jgi:hypothetical protein